MFSHFATVINYFATTFGHFMTTAGLTARSRGAWVGGGSREGARLDHAWARLSHVHTARSQVRGRYIYGTVIHHLGDDHSLKNDDKNINHFTIFVRHSKTKYINNLKLLTKIING
jgi:hypothetical protein